MLAHRRTLIAVTFLCSPPARTLELDAGPGGGGETRARPKRAASFRPALSRRGRAPSPSVSARPSTRATLRSRATTPSGSCSATCTTRRYAFDCDGHVRPAGSSTAGKRTTAANRWTFHLREGAQFWDGAPVTAQDIVFGKGGVGYTLASAREKRRGTHVRKRERRRSRRCSATRAWR